MHEWVKLCLRATAYVACLRAGAEVWNRRQAISTYAGG